MSDDRPSRYTVTSPPDLPESLANWNYREFRKLAATINDLVERAPGEYSVEPVVPRIGMLVYAKAPWDPGSGDGLYVYKPSGWVFVI